MKQKSKIQCLILCMIIFFVSLFVSCAIPRKFWPQSDITPNEVHSSTLEKKLLIASRSSGFKEAVAEQIKMYFEPKNIFIKIMGLDELENESADDYSVIVILNTNIAWDIDPKVNDFLEDNPNHEHVIVLTTSGDPDWKVDLKGRKFDAITSASEEANVMSISEKIIDRINIILEQ